MRIGVRAGSGIDKGPRMCYLFLYVAVALDSVEVQCHDPMKETNEASFLDFPHPP